MGKVLAVAANTVKQALRMRVALVFIVLLLVLLPVMAWSSTGDGTPKGRLQTFVSYGLSLTSLLLSVLTILMMCHTATHDIVQRQVFTVLCKPIRRWQFLLGKCVGVLFIDVALLVLFSSFIYIVAVMIPRYIPMTERDAAILQTQFFSARVGIKPKLEDISDEEIDILYKELETSKQLDRFFEEGIPERDIRKRLRNVKQLQKSAAAPGQTLLWEFNNIKPMDPNEMFFVRFKYDVAQNPPDLKIHSFWEMGDDRQYRSNEPPTTPMARFQRSDEIRTPREIAVPAKVIAKDGYLGVLFGNDPKNTTSVIFPIDQGVEILYHASSFGMNFFRAVLLVCFRLIFLCAISLFASSFLSFPVATLFCFALFIMASVSGFILESFATMDASVGQFYDYTLKYLIELLPKFDKANPASFLISGRLITMSLLLKAGMVMVGLWSMISVGFGLLIYSRREVAKTD